MPRRRVVVSLASLLLACAAPAGAVDRSEEQGPFKSVEYRLIGPAAGGRACRAAGVPGDPLTAYLATAAGGLWKTSDGGLHWNPVFDDQPDASVGSVAVAPSNPAVVYVGAGEGNPRGNVAEGRGIYRSRDAGKTWQHVWKQRGQIGRMVVHPHDPDTAYAAVLGRPFGPNPERGVYRTRDGGKTWQQTLAVDADTGACDLALDPNRPDVLFAGMWAARRTPWSFSSGGPTGGIHVSRDGGDTWTRIGGAGVPKEKLKGLPEGIYGKIALAVAPSDSRRVYALIEAEKDKGGLYRSDDGGESWKQVNGARYLGIRPWYFTHLTVDPARPDVIWVSSLHLLKSLDGGASFKKVKGPHHGDHHDVWIDPQNPRRVINVNDGGVDLSNNGGETWFAPMLPISQFYHVATDGRTPYHVSGAMQDLGTASGPSRSLSSGGIALSDWHDVGGGEAGHTAPDPANPDVVYAGEYQGFLSRFDHKTRQAASIGAYPMNGSGHGAGDLRYRFNWTAPLVASRHDPGTVYHGAQVVLKTTDGGRTWAAISPDLTRNDKDKQKFSGGPITGDNTGAEFYGTVFALAESPLQKDLLWAGTDDGRVHLTRDGGKTWTEVTGNLPGLPQWASIAAIELSPFDEGTAYLVADAHRLDDVRPYLWRTTDFGKTWQSLAGGLAADVYLHAVRCDPKQKGLLFLGTERGVSYSTDDGATWQPLKLNLPTVPVHDLRVKDDDLVVGTHGRSIWVLDDLTFLRRLTPEAGKKDVALFPAPPAVRYRTHGGAFGGSKQTTFENPKGGALITYHLGKKVDTGLTLEITDAAGKLVDRFTDKEDKPDEPEEGPDAPDEPHKKPHLTNEPGVQRFAWDLAHAGARKLKGAKIDGGELESGPLVVPGTYKATLIAGGDRQTVDVVVRPDPRVSLAAQEYLAAEKFALDTRAALDRTAGYVDTLRSLKKQIAAQNDLLAADPKAKELVARGQKVLAKCDALEERLHNPRAQVVYDILAQPGGAKLYSRLASIFDQAKGADAVPGQGLREVQAELFRELDACGQELRALVDKDVRGLNEEARRLEVPRVLAP